MSRSSEEGCATLIILGGVILVNVAVFAAGVFIIAAAVKWVIG